VLEAAVVERAEGEKDDAFGARVMPEVLRLGMPCAVMPAERVTGETGSMDGALQFTLAADARDEAVKIGGGVAISRVLPEGTELVRVPVAGGVAITARRGDWSAAIGFERA
jgi:hypothetical protein